MQLAYKVWYNEDLPENKINKIFSEYMFIRRAEISALLFF